MGEYAPVTFHARVGICPELLLPDLRDPAAVLNASHGSHQAITQAPESPKAGCKAEPDLRPREGLCPRAEPGRRAEAQHLTEAQNMCCDSRLDIRYRKAEHRLNQYWYGR